VEVIVGVKIAVAVNTVAAVGGVCPIPCVRAKDVSVASISIVGVGVKVGRLHANAAADSILNRIINPLFFFTRTSITGKTSYSVSVLPESERIPENRGADARPLPYFRASTSYFVIY